MDNSRFKFRAWYPVDQQMTYSDQSNWGAWGDCEMSDMVSGSCDIMQFTGLHDCNGKEIYEGDLIESNKNMFDPSQGKQIREVIFENGSFNIGNINLFIITEIPWQFNTKIIGNIHEHPNLLKL